MNYKRCSIILKSINGLEKMYCDHLTVTVGWVEEKKISSLEVSAKKGSGLAGLLPTGH